MEKLHRNSTKQKFISTVSAKPILGKPLGAFKFTFRYLDGTAIEFEGDVSDVSGLFLGAKIQRDFKKVINAEAKIVGVKEFFNVKSEVMCTANGEQVEKNICVESSTPTTELATPQTEKKSLLAEAVELFQTYDFAKACRVLLLEESFNHQKHLILQIKNTQLLTEYAFNLDGSQWSFVRGLKYDYLVAGRASTCSHKKRLKELGEIFIHVFIPENHSDTEDSDITSLSDVAPLLEIIPYIPQTVDIDEYLKAKESEIRSKESTLRLARGDLSEKAARNDAGAIAVAGAEEFDNFKNLHNRFDFTDALIIGGPTFGIAFLGYLLHPMGWLGMGAGLLLGCYFVSRRK